MNSLVMTILGPDRPGLVEALAKLVASHGANWLESRMAHLAGQFAGIVHVEVDSSRAEQLMAALGRLRSEGLTVIVQHDAAPPTVAVYLPLRLELIGHDRPGIVHEVTRLLADRRVNVEEFQTECVSAPMSGERLFRATATLRLPTGLAIDELQHALERIANDLMVDIRLQSAEAGDA
jgi:glycine cleavage system regulatory protein